MQEVLIFLIPEFFTLGDIQPYFDLYDELYFDLMEAERRAKNYPG